MFFEVLKSFRFIMLLIFFILYKNIKKESNLVNKINSNIDVLIFAFSFFFSVFFSIDKGIAFFYSIWFTLSIFSIIVYFSLLSLKFNRNDGLFAFFQLVFWSNVIIIPLGLLNISNLFLGSGFDIAYGSSSFYAYNLFSIVVSVLCSHLFVGKSLFQVKYKTILEIIIVLLSILFSFYSARRSPTMMILFIVISFMFFKYGKSKISKILILVIITAFVSIIFPLFEEFVVSNNDSGQVFIKFTQMLDSKGNIIDDKSFKDREDIWIVYDKIIDKNPIFGNGSGNSVISYSEMTNNTESNIVGFSPHSLFKGLIVENGYLGLILFIIVLLKSISIIYNKSRSNSNEFSIYLVMIFIPITIINSNEFNLIPGQVFFWTTFMFYLMPRMLISKKQTIHQN